MRVIKLISPGGLLSVSLLFSLEIRMARDSLKNKVLILITLVLLQSTRNILAMKVPSLKLDGIFIIQIFLLTGLRYTIIIISIIINALISVEELEFKRSVYLLCGIIFTIIGTALGVTDAVLGINDGSGAEDVGILTPTWFFVILGFAIACLIIGLIPHKCDGRITFFVKMNP